MPEKVSIVIHDWEDWPAVSELARAISEGSETGRSPRFAVAASSAAGAARDTAGRYGFEVVEVPDGSPPGARKNAGLRAAGGDAVLISSASLPADGTWFESLLEGAASLGGVGVAGCKVVDTVDLIDNAGLSVIGDGRELYREGGMKKDINQYYYTREVEGVDSRCMYVKREALEGTGGFDEVYGGGYDDVDFCLKAKVAGFRVACVGATRVIIDRGPRGVQPSEEDPAIKDSFRERWSPYLHDRYDTKVMWHSWINAPTGYAVSSQYLVLALEELGVEVRYGFVYGVEEPPNEDERIMEVRRRPKDLEITQVVYGQGDVFFKNSGRYRIGYSMLEVTGIPGDWVEQANALDEVWVPSHFNKETFSASGVTRPIRVMPLGVDVNYFHPFIRTRKFDDRFVFLSVFEWGERKAPEILLQAYNQEFSSEEDVLLLLKVTNTDPGVSIERQIEAMRLRPDRAPVVIMLNQNIPSYQMGALYCASDCFVLPTRGEGWGMPTLEAMACGLPVISTPWSAQTEFFNDQVGYPVSLAGLIPAVAKCPYYEGFSWANPDVEDLSALMRHVFENPEEGRAKGMRASIAARDKWTWLDAAGRIKKRLLEI